VSVVRQVVPGPGVAVACQLAADRRGRSVKVTGDRAHRPTQVVQSSDLATLVFGQESSVVLGRCGSGHAAEPDLDAIDRARAHAGSLGDDRTLLAASQQAVNQVKLFIGDRWVSCPHVASLLGAGGVATFL